ncbi:MAG: 50S ribosomal protein L32 [Actinobacteria bacterium]|nr:50S ribosomal protein L32 [Actinomycetota bacterium]
MAPLPKRKHSTRRKGKRLASKLYTFQKLVVCPNCHKKKLAHSLCKYCGK